MFKPSDEFTNKEGSDRASSEAADRLEVIRRKSYSEDQNTKRKASAYEPSDEELAVREASLQKDGYTSYEAGENRPHIGSAASADKSTESNPSTSQVFIAEQQQRSTDPRRETNREAETAAREQQRVVREQQEEERAYQRQLRRQQRALQRKVITKAKVIGKVTKTSTKLRVIALNRMAYWVIFPVVMAQIYLGIIQLFMIGMVIAVGSSWLARVVNAATEWFSWFVSFGNSSFSMAEGFLGLGGLAWLAIIAIGMLEMFALAVAYMLIGAKPFNSGLKIGMFTLAVIGYCLPFSNMLPCILVWMLAVQLQPK